MYKNIYKQIFDTFDFSNDKYSHYYLTSLLSRRIHVMAVDPLNWFLARSSSKSLSSVLAYALGIFSINSSP